MTRQEVCKEVAEIRDREGGKIMKYRKKPVIIEAIQWNGENYFEQLEDFINCEKWLTGDAAEIIIKTLEGKMVASIDDFIIKGVNGEFYPCKPDIFHKSYEKIER